MRTTLALVLLSTLISACSFIPAKPGADKIVLLPENFVGHCKLIGQTNAMVPTKFGFIEHGDESIEKSLAAIARNDAAELKNDKGEKGDTIVKASPIKDGRQSFKIYKCGK